MATVNPPYVTAASAPDNSLRRHIYSVQARIRKPAAGAAYGPRGGQKAVIPSARLLIFYRKKVKKESGNSTIYSRITPYLTYIPQKQKNDIFDEIL